MRNEVLRYERIRNLRIDRNLSQREVAALLNVRQNTYSQYEIGVLNYPIDVDQAGMLLQHQRGLPVRPHGRADALSQGKKPGFLKISRCIPLTMGV